MDDDDLPRCEREGFIATTENVVLHNFNVEDGDDDDHNFEDVLEVFTSH